MSKVSESRTGAAAFNYSKKRILLLLFSRQFLFFLHRFLFHVFFSFCLCTFLAFFHSVRLSLSFGLFLPFSFFLALSCSFFLFVYEFVCIHSYGARSVFNSLLFHLLIVNAASCVTGALHIHTYAIIPYLISLFVSNIRFCHNFWIFFFPYCFLHECSMNVIKWHVKIPNNGAFVILLPKKYICTKSSLYRVNYHHHRNEV